MKTIDIYAHQDFGHKIAESLTRKGCPINEIITNINVDQTIDFGGDYRFYFGWEFGKKSILSAEVVNKYFCVAVHNGPLPKYRGGDIVHHQLANGEKLGYVSFLKANEVLDGGLLYLSIPFSLENEIDKIYNDIINVSVEGTRQFLSDINNIRPTQIDIKESKMYHRLGELEKGYIIWTHHDKIKNKKEVQMNGKI